MPIRIIRFKPPRQEQLREVAAKLSQFVAGMGPPPLSGPATLSYFDGLETCLGCGRFHTFLCPQCRENAPSAKRPGTSRRDPPLDEINFAIRRPRQFETAEVILRRMFQKRTTLSWTEAQLYKIKEITKHPSCAVLRSYPGRPVAHPVLDHVDYVKRRAELASQAKEILAKHPRKEKK